MCHIFYYFHIVKRVKYLETKSREANQIKYVKTKKYIFINYFKVCNRELLENFILLTVSKHINLLRCFSSPCCLSFCYVICFHFMFHFCLCVYPNYELFHGSMLINIRFNKKKLVEILGHGGMIVWFLNLYLLMQSVDTMYQH